MSLQEAIEQVEAIQEFDHPPGGRDHEALQIALSIMRRLDGSLKKAMEVLPSGLEKVAGAALPFKIHPIDGIDGWRHE